MHREGVDALGAELVLLVLHQGDERTDDDGEPVEHQRGELVDERLAAPRRHDDERVPPLEQRLHRLPLAMLEIGMPKLLPQQHACAGFDPVLRHAGAQGRKGA